MIRLLLCVGLGYLGGGILFARLLPLWCKGIDITVLAPDGNPGTANAIKYAGVPLGMLCLLCDLFKGALPVLLALRGDTHSWLLALAIVAPVCGHAFPLLHRFHGGKAIAAAFGVLLGLLPLTVLPVLLLAGFYLFFSLIVVLHPNERRSVWAFSCLFVCVSVLTLCGVLSPVICIGILPVCAICGVKNVLKSALPDTVPPDETAGEHERPA